MCANELLYDFTLPNGLSAGTQNYAFCDSSLAQSILVGFTQQAANERLFRDAPYVEKTALGIALFPTPAELLSCYV